MSKRSIPELVAEYLPFYGREDRSPVTIGYEKTVSGLYKIIVLCADGMKLTVPNSLSRQDFAREAKRTAEVLRNQKYSIERIDVPKD